MLAIIGQRGASLRDGFKLLFFKQKTAYEMRISDWSSDVCSSDLMRDGYDVPPREATEAEIKWCRKMKALMAKKPKTITLFCNGSMHVLCTKAVNSQVAVGGGMPQPIRGVQTLG